MSFLLNKKLRKQNAENIADSTINYLLSLAAINEKIYVDISLQDIKDEVSQQDGRFDYLSDTELLSAIQNGLEKIANNPDYIVISTKLDTSRVYLRKTNVNPLEYNEAKDILTSSNCGEDDHLFKQAVISIINNYIKTRCAEGKTEIPIFVSGIDAIMTNQHLELYRTNLSAEPTTLMKQTMANYAKTADARMNAKFADDVLLIKFA